ncbi:MAG TPA: lipopolysaccharide transport periplasmic protein LptA [Gammaproteobacteria bacterium]|nr:lipopolysaccharide transport periplasmic protein LptA [Gammaproteobacteria bacterium]
MRLKLLLLLTSCVFSTLTLASGDNSQQPVHIEADRAEIDEVLGMMTYTGHVIVRQGSIEMRADTVVVYSKEGELQRITAQGQPAHYLQERADGKIVKGTSQRMEYSADSKQVVLLGKAQLWQGGNRFSGNRIQYDSNAERVLANAGGNTDATGEQQRVTVTLQPRPKKTDTKP